MCECLDEALDKQVGWPLMMLWIMVLLSGLYTYLGTQLCTNYHRKKRGEKNGLFPVLVGNAVAAEGVPPSPIGVLSLVPAFGWT